METTILFVVLTVCLLFRFSRTGLLMAYLFVYRWGWTFRDKAAFSDPAMQATFTAGYVVFGILVLTFAIVGLISASHARDTAE